MEIGPGRAIALSEVNVQQAIPSSIPLITTSGADL